MKAKRPQVLITLDETSEEPLYLQVYEAIRQQILSGAIREGEKVPSIRSVVQELGISHATVERAYTQLALEGYVQAVPRSGYVAAHLDLGYFHEAAEQPQEEKQSTMESKSVEFYDEAREGDEARYDFAYTSLQPGSFPRRTWRRLSSEVIRDMDDAELVSYYHKSEPCLLQKQLADYLQRARGVHCQPEQVILQPGTEAAITSVIQLVQTPGEILELAHEEPGFDVMVAVARRFGAHLISAPSQGEASDFLRALDEANPKLIFTTPSHQFPTGNMMPMEVRIRLLQWAADHDAYIIEDDSCNEYRYETRAIPSLQSMDRNNRVIYMCNFSKALSPGLRIAYFVLPPLLLEKWNSLFTFSYDTVSYTVREALGLFLQRGYWDTHLRRMVTGNKKRHDELVAAFGKEFGNRVTLFGKDSGMHLYVQVHNDMSQKQLLQSAFDQGVKVYGTQRYYWSGNNVPEDFVIVGFSAILQEDILPGVQALRRAWFPQE